VHLWSDTTFGSGRYAVRRGVERKRTTGFAAAARHIWIVKGLQQGRYCTARQDVLLKLLGRKQGAAMHKHVCPHRHYIMICKVESRSKLEGQHGQHSQRGRRQWQFVLGAAASSVFRLLASPQKWVSAVRPEVKTLTC